MAELLASNQDVNGFLPDDKLQATDSNSSIFQVDAVQLIRGQLASSFAPTILVGWDSPDDTPVLVRQIAARLIAAQIYKKAYSEERSQLPQYAQDIYDQAIEMLQQIRSGALIITDSDGNPIATDLLNLDSDDVFPNNASTDGPYFTMTQRFA
jgi:hypothetical protein